MEPTNIQTQAEILESIKSLKEKMHTGVVKFKYTKVNGTIREATGTLNFGVIPEADHPSKYPINPDNVRYYDLDAMAWRSFRPQVVEVTDYQETTEL